MIEHHELCIGAAYRLEGWDRPVLVTKIRDGKYVEYETADRMGCGSREVDVFCRKATRSYTHEASIDNAIALLRTLSPEQRMTVFRTFCRSCGGDDPACQCWNDE